MPSLGSSPLFCLLALLPAPDGLASEPPVTALAFAPDGRSVLAGSQAGLVVRSWPDLKPVRKLPTTLSHIHDLAFSPRGDVLAAGGGSPAESGAVELFRWPEGTRFYHDEPHDDLVYALAWKDDGSAWASASHDRTVQVHAPGGETVRALEGHSKGVVGLCYLPDGRSLVSAGIDQSLRVWDAESGRPLRRLENHTGPVRGLALRPSRPDGSPPMVVSIGADRTARVWQPTVGRMVRLSRLESPPLAVAWARSGASIAVACADGHVRLIDTDTAVISRDIHALDGRAQSLASAPDGRALVVGGEAGRLVRIELEPPPDSARSGTHQVKGSSP
jgi:WD40 repeat protein